MENLAFRIVPHFSMDPLYTMLSDLKSLLSKRRIIEKLLEKILLIAFWMNLSRYSDQDKSFCPIEIIVLDG
jgi:hypothetical protein